MGGMPTTLSLTLVGFGAVNRALARLIAREYEWFLEEKGLHVCYHAIVARHGSWEAESEPLSAAKVGALADAVAAQEVRLDGTTPPPEGVCAHALPSTEDVLAIIGRTPPGLSVLVEAIDVDYTAGEPATTFLREALSRGSHAVSANKGPVVHHRAALLAAAEAAGVRYLHESAVMDGVPIFRRAAEMHASRRPLAPSPRPRSPDLLCPRCAARGGVGWSLAALDWFDFEGLSTRRRAWCFQAWNEARRWSR